MGLALSTWMIDRKLRSVSTRLKATEAEIRELSEQTLTLRDDVADAEGDALVGGRVEAQSAHQAHRHLDKITNRLVELRATAATLRSKQDELLDQMSKGSW